MFNKNKAKSQHKSVKTRSMTGAAAGNRATKKIASRLGKRSAAMTEYSNNVIPVDSEANVANPVEEIFCHSEEDSRMTTEGMKEMVGGCCICSDECGGPEDPLVYCAGLKCTVAVHQACYGILTVPSGPWYCRKCESEERSTRVRCKLCPSRDGALKKTNDQGWVHVVCALYIPEVRFGNVTTMEPIILQLIPQGRYTTTCYICQEAGKANRATIGVCIKCSNSNCKKQFHVTCAQSLGLLREEASNILGNIRYSGYCQHHYGNLKKRGYVKTIAPSTPKTHYTSSDCSLSPDMEIHSATFGGGVVARSTSNSRSSSNSSSSYTEKDKHSNYINKNTSSSKDTDEEGGSNSPSHDNHSQSSGSSLSGQTNQMVRNLTTSSSNLGSNSNVNITNTKDNSKISTSSGMIAGSFGSGHISSDLHPSGNSETSNFSRSVMESACRTSNVCNTSNTILVGSKSKADSKLNVTAAANDFEKEIGKSTKKQRTELSPLAHQVENADSNSTQSEKNTYTPTNAISASIAHSISAKATISTVHASQKYTLSDTTISANASNVISATSNSHKSADSTISSFSSLSGSNFSAGKYHHPDDCFASQTSAATATAAGTTNITVADTNALNLHVSMPLSTANVPNINLAIWSEHSYSKISHFGGNTSGPRTQHSVIHQSRKSPSSGVMVSDTHNLMGTTTESGNLIISGYKEKDEQSQNFNKLSISITDKDKEGGSNSASQDNHSQTNQMVRNLTTSSSNLGSNSNVNITNTKDNSKISTSSGMIAGSFESGHICSDLHPSGNSETSNFSRSVMESACRTSNVCKLNVTAAANDFEKEIGKSTKKQRTELSPLAHQVENADSNSTQSEKNTYTPTNAISASIAHSISANATISTVHASQKYTLSDTTISANASNVISATSNSHKSADSNISSFSSLSGSKSSAGKYHHPDDRFASQTTAVADTNALSLHVSMPLSTANAPNINLAIWSEHSYSKISHFGGNTSGPGTQHSGNLIISGYKEKDEQSQNFNKISISITDKDKEGGSNSASHDYHSHSSSSSLSGQTNQMVRNLTTSSSNLGSNSNVNITNTKDNSKISTSSGMIAGSFGSGHINSDLHPSGNSETSNISRSVMESACRTSNVSNTSNTILVGSKSKADSKLNVTAAANDFEKEIGKSTKKQRTELSPLSHQVENADSNSTQSEKNTYTPTNAISASIAHSISANATISTVHASQKYTLSDTTISANASNVISATSNSHKSAGSNISSFSSLSGSNFSAGKYHHPDDRFASQTTAATATAAGPTNITVADTNALSLHVSMPLSTANVPNINLAIWSEHSYSKISHFGGNTSGPRTQHSVIHQSRKSPSSGVMVSDTHNLMGTTTESGYKEKDEQSQNFNKISISSTDKDKEGGSNSASHDYHSQTNQMVRNLTTSSSNLGSNSNVNITNTKDNSKISTSSGMIAGSFGSGHICSDLHPSGNSETSNFSRSVMESACRTSNVCNTSNTILVGSKSKADSKLNVTAAANDFEKDIGKSTKKQRTELSPLAHQVENADSNSTQSEKNTYTPTNAISASIAHSISAKATISTVHASQKYTLSDTTISANASNVISSTSNSHKSADSNISSFSLLSGSKSSAGKYHHPDDRFASRTTVATATAAGPTNITVVNGASVADTNESMPLSTANVPTINLPLLSPCIHHPFPALSEHFGGNTSGLGTQHSVIHQSGKSPSSGVMVSDTHNLMGTTTESGYKEKDEQSQNFNKISISSTDKDKEGGSNSASHDNHSQTNQMVRNLTTSSSNLGSNSNVNITNTKDNSKISTSSGMIAGSFESGHICSDLHPSGNSETSNFSRSVMESACRTSNVCNTSNTILVGSKSKADSKLNVTTAANDFEKEIGKSTKKQRTELSPLAHQVENADSKSTQSEKNTYTPTNAISGSIAHSISANATISTVHASHKYTLSDTTISANASNVISATSNSHKSAGSNISSFSSLSGSNFSAGKYHHPDDRFASQTTAATATAAGPTSITVVNGASVADTNESMPLSTANVPIINLPLLSPRIYHQFPALSEHSNTNSIHFGGNTSGLRTQHSVIHRSGKFPSSGVMASGTGNLMDISTESGNLKICYEKQNTQVNQLQDLDTAPVRRSRTPCSGIFSSSSSGAGYNNATNSGASTASSSISSISGMKFTYEAQSTTADTLPIDSSAPFSTAVNATTTSNSTKELPPSSPSSEVGPARKRRRKAKESPTNANANDLKDEKVFYGIPPAHMLGNVLNPNSKVAQELSDLLHQEIQDHKINKPEEVTPQLVRVPFSPALSKNSDSATIAPSYTPLLTAMNAKKTSNSTKELPPSSPSSEVGSPRKRRRKARESPTNANANDPKDEKIIHGIPPAHMLGNVLNPNSNVAQELSDLLHQEIQDHRINKPEAVTPQLVRVPFSPKLYINSDPATIAPSYTPLLTAVNAKKTSNSTKELPPSSPSSEVSSARKRRRKPKEAPTNANANDPKDEKIFYGIPPAHMLGNVLNPNSNVAQELSDLLHQEIQDHSIYNPEAVTPQFVSFPTVANPATNAPNYTWTTGTNATTGSSSSTATGNTENVAGGSRVNDNMATPQSFEQLFERELEQGSQLPMEEQAQHELMTLLARHEQLLRVYARLRHLFLNEQNTEPSTLL